MLVSIAKYFLRFHFDGLETRRQYSGVWFRLELVNSKGVTEYRRMIWNNLKEMYSHGIEVEAIEDILYNYGNPSSKKSKEIIENDQPYIFNLLNLFRNKESYYFCCILSHLQSIPDSYIQVNCRVRVISAIVLIFVFFSSHME